jgi:endonuclease-3
MAAKPRTTSSPERRGERGQAAQDLRVARANPEPTTELTYSTPFELLVAVVLSAQATDVGVNKATAKLFPVANTPAAILELGEEGLKSYIKTIGLFNSKAKNLMKTCATLVTEHGGAGPRDQDTLSLRPAWGKTRMSS